MQCMNRKKLLTKFLIASLAVRVINFSPVISYENNLQIISVVHAEIRTYEAVGRAEFNFGENNPQLVEMAKNYARMNAVQAAKEKAGIYLKSFSRTLGGNVTDDDISVVANNSAEILDVKFKQIPYVSHDVHGNATGEIGIAYEAVAIVKIDSNELSRYIKHNQQEKYILIKQNKESQKNIADINKNVEELKNNPQKATATEILKINNRIMSEQKKDEGDKLLAKKDFEGAISKYSEALQFNPNFVFAYYNRGNAHYNLKNYEQAISDYEKIIQFNPNYSDYYIVLGNAYGGLQNYEKAIENYNKAIKLNPNKAACYNNRGVTYTKLQNYEKAISDFSIAIQLSPRSSTAYTNLGNVYSKLKDYSQAILYFNKSIQLNPNWSVSYCNRGFVYNDLKNYELALSDFNKAIQINAKFAKSYYGRGLCYQALGENEKAEKDFAKARELGWKG